MQTNKRTKNGKTKREIPINETIFQEQVYERSSSKKTKKQPILDILHSNHSFNFQHANIRLISITSTWKVQV